MGEPGMHGVVPGVQGLVAVPIQARAPGSSRCRPLLLADAAVDALAQEIGVAAVPRVLRDLRHQDVAELLNG